LPQINTRGAQDTIFEEPFAPTSPRSQAAPPVSSSSPLAVASTSSASALLPSQSPTSLSFLSQDPNPTDFPPNYNLSRRTSVSAESLAPQATPAVRRASGGQPKTSQQQGRIRSAIAANLLFKNLDDEQTRDVLDAMSEKKIPKEGVTVIHQGDVGDFFYVVEQGTFDFFIRKPVVGQAELGDKVGSVGPGGSFGELALMYNAPRAASVVSTSQGVLWALDRITFRRILMDV
jgi:cAMP-dependent protein kinase regulator